jgi:hypothetical protein
MTRTLALAALASLILGLPEAALAHGRSTSMSSWDIRDAERPSARVRVQATWLDLQRALPELGGLTPRVLATRPDLAAAVDAYLTSHYRLQVNGVACDPTAPRASPVPDATHVARRWRIQCSLTGERSVRADGFTEVMPAHLHLARLRIDEAAPLERVFVLASPLLELDRAEGRELPRASSFREFVRLGIEHIATGWDHLAFLLALLLVGVTVWEVATVVTGFTVAHSLTLAVGVLGWVRPQAGAVEALIGLSIVVVALENTALTVSARGRRTILVALAALFAVSTAAALTGRVAIPALALAGIGLFSLCYFGLLSRVARPFRLRWLLAFVFGLVHGFGFAGILTEMELPPSRLAPALLGFNVGVELGQLAIVAVAWPFLRALLRGPQTRRQLVVQAGSAAVLAAGIFWFASRALAAGPP